MWLLHCFLSRRVLFEPGCQGGHTQGAFFLYLYIVREELLKGLLRGLYRGLAEQMIAASSQHRSKAKRGDLAQDEDALAGSVPGDGFVVDVGTADRRHHQHQNHHRTLG